MQIFHDCVSQRSAGKPLAQYLAMSFPFVALNWAEHITSGGVLVNKQRIAGDYVIEATDNLMIVIHNYGEDPVNTFWKLLWEGEDVFAVHKPADLPVCRTTRHVINTLVERVKAQSPWFDAHLLHRLDHDTSGIVLFGKTKEAAKKWQPKIQTWLSKKIYHAVVYGQPNWTTTDFCCELSPHSDSLIRSKMYVCQGEERGQFSRTKFKQLSTTGKYSLIECELFTGRKHQIRAHLSALGCPIVGDKIYAHEGAFYLKRLSGSLSTSDWLTLKTPHHLLMAQQLVLKGHDNDTQTVITDHHYPEAWVDFCHKESLTLPMKNDPINIE